MRDRIRLPDFPVEGGCQCGAVRYRLAARPRGVYRCHCKDCQRFSGTAFAMSMIVRKDDFAPISGTTMTRSKTADSGRVALMHSCAACGVILWNEPLAAPDILVLKPGTLDDMSWAVPVGNIWTASRVKWVEIEDDLPAFEGQPASRDALYEAWGQLVTETE